jgi:hypothetical protein
MDDINKLNETGGAGDWGTDKARARLQKDTPGQEITKGKKMKTFKDVLQKIDESSIDINESTRDYVDNILPKALKKAGVKCNIIKKQSYTSYDCGNGYQIINNGVGIEVKKDIPRGKDVFYYNKPRLDYKKAVSQVSESQSIEEAMSAADKKKRLAMIKQAVEKINRNNAEKAKKDALAMMKASGMFDEEVELDEALGNKNPSHREKLKLDKDGTIHNIPGKKMGSAYSIKPRIDGGVLKFGTVDEFGNINTMSLADLAKVIK